MSYGDFGSDDSWDEPAQCYQCGRPTRVGICAQCDIGDGYESKLQAEGWYASGWIWDPLDEGLAHRTLHRFGPFLTEDKAKMVWENLSSPTDLPEDGWLKPTVYEVRRVVMPTMPALEVDTQGRFLIPMARRR